MKIKNIIVLLLALACLNAFGQQTRKITGKLVTSAGEPVANATITLTATGTVGSSSEDGSFIFRYNGNADTLLITHIGYTALSIPLSSATASPLYITLTEAAGKMQEVIVNTGYQQLPKERATGSFTQIDNSTLNQQVSTDVISRLPAIANGLSEGRKTSQGSYSSNGNILIRGLSTINGLSAPLIVVDNFPYEGDIENINPNDVESITLLKDAAAASIWGARAGNGVIVITTKKGHFQQKITAEVTTNVKFTGKPNLFYDQSISPGDLVDLEQFLFNNQYRFSDTLSDSHIPFSPIYEILFGERNGSISGSDAASQIDLLRNHDVRNDFSRFIYRQSANQQYALNIRGGNNNIAWLLSGGFDKNLDVLSAGYTRVSLQSENTLQLTNRLQLNTSLYFVESGNTSGRPGYGNIITVNGSLPIYTMLGDADGNPLPLAKDYRQPYINDVGAAYPKLPGWNYYPLEDYKHSHSTNDVQDITARLGISYVIFKRLKAEINYRYEKQTTTGKNINDEQSYYTRNLINTFYQPATNSFPVPLGSILDVSTASLTSNTARGQLSFNKSRGNNSITAIAGAEVKQLKGESSSYRSYGYNKDILTHVPVDLVNYYSSFVTGYGMSIPDYSGFDETVNNFVSLYANAAYTFKRRYTVSLSGRRDASNIFGVNTNNKWNPLWSAGTSYRISDEKFYHSHVLPYLKVRATYGVSGNIDPSLSAVTTISYRSASPYTQLPYAQVSKFYNPDLRWEKNKQVNFGIDFSTAGNRVAGSIDYYIKKGIDLYGPSPLDQTTGLGVGTITKNAAAMVAKGMDIEINSLNIKGKIDWTTNLNLSVYHDKVTSYYLNITNGSNFISDGISISGIVGKPVHSVLSYKWAGLDPLTGDPLGYSGGKISKDYDDIIYYGTSIPDLVYSGPAFPTVYGSLGNTISYKGFSLTARLTWKLGYYFKKISVNYTTLYNSLSGSADYAKRWQKPGDEQITNVPSMIYPAISSRDDFYNNSQVMVEKGDHIRMQYITLGYNIPGKHWKQLPFKNLNVYINFNDIGIIWRANKDGLDPDYTIGSIPPSRNVAVGMRINF